MLHECCSSALTLCPDLSESCSCPFWHQVGGQTVGDCIGWYHCTSEKATWDAHHYRGIHLTTHLSKVIERTIQSMCTVYSEVNNVAGPNQFAYRETGAQETHWPS